MSVEISSTIVEHGIPGGPLRKRQYREDDSREVHLFLAYCPVCGPEVALDGQKKASWHIAKHDPEDFGLSPIGGSD